MVRQKVAPPRTSTILAVAAALAVAGCSDSAQTTSTTSTTTTAPGPTTTTTATSTTTTPPADDRPSSDLAFPDGLRDVRYCEVLLLSQVDGAYVAEVYNTLGLDECVQDEWEAIDAAAVAEERGVLLALKNGPRYWTLDTIVSDIRAGAQETAFGDVEMFLAATVELGTKLPEQTPYTERTVVRETIFRFDAGTEVHELTDPSGTVYVMQSYSQGIDPTMDSTRLAHLGGELELPAGWTYVTRVLDEQLDVLSAAGRATVVQDELQNTYQRIEG